MATSPKRKYSKRNFHQEAELQIQILEQKAREEFLVSFAQNEDTKPEQTKETNRVQSKEDAEAKIYIPAKAKSILEKWMYEHRLYCYPTKAEKQALALETGLSVQKISNWFINSRRRMLPKMLQTEGRNPVNFTISRKKKKLIEPAPTSAPTTSALSESEAFCSSNGLTDYAIDEESKIIDQNSILFGKELEIEEPCDNPYYEKIIQEMIENETDNDSKMSSNEQPNQIKKTTHVSRGILYDHSTQSKCLFIIINSSN